MTYCCHCRSLEWLCETCCSHIAAENSGGGNTVVQGSLLELHCGFAHSTVALSPYFTRVLGVELNRHLAEAAKHNLSKNHIHKKKVAQNTAAADVDYRVDLLHLMLRLL